MLKEDNNGVTYAKGFKAAGVKAGIKKSGNLDLALIVSDTKAAVAGTFTQNKVAAAPVYHSKEVVAQGSAQAIVINSGCANACTGTQGKLDAAQTAEAAANELGIDASSVLVASTGVIGVNLPMDKIKTGIKKAAHSLSDAPSTSAAEAIITTDTHIKSFTTALNINGKEIHIGAIAKGSGMIQPNMATMLCFITTDIAIAQPLLQHALSKVVEKSFNMISVDGDMSTNDMAVVLANGQAGNTELTCEDDNYRIFYKALFNMCCTIAKTIAADGEGATKFITINIQHGKSFADAKKVGMAVANSPLIKTAFFGEDPNWGRVICAVGYCDADVDPQKVIIKFGNITVYKNGQGADFDKTEMQKTMSAHDVIIDIDLMIGEADATVWTCDLSYEYVKINGEYHT